ncbi:TPA: hypothetical protein ACSP1O_004015, partial [Aeromonas veronii]
MDCLSEIVFDHSCQNSFVALAGFKVGGVSFILEGNKTESPNKIASPISSIGSIDVNELKESG